MKTSTYFVFYLLLIVQLTYAQEPNNLKPRYGDIVKSQEYIDTDNKFIDEVVKQFGTREIAAKKHVKFGWDYFRKGDLSTAMKRFNQAWLLDSTLIDVNWGFGAVLGSLKEYEEAIDYLKKYQCSYPNNDRIYIDLASAYFQYASSQEEKGLNESWELNLNKGKSCIKKSLIINDKNANAYGQLAVAYYYQNNIDSARYYGQIAIMLDPKALDLRFKKAVGID